ncbi:MAG: NAD(P)-dependent oxidoreductase [Desulfovibrionaceae bacterium]|jgi:D-3-phosphoglycerate dehydrogenase
MPTVLVTTSSFGVHDACVLDRLTARGLTPVINPYGRKLTEDELLELLRQHRPVGLLAGTEPITRRVMETALPELRAIARVGVGWDNVDHPAAAELGLRVSRTVGVLDQCVAELAIGFMLSALRSLPRHTSNICCGVWKKEMGFLLSGKQVGIVGYGAIGRRVASLLDAFGARVGFFDPQAEAGESCPHNCLSSMEELCRSADIISLHASVRTRLLGARELAWCKPGVGIVNTARGGQIDEQALYDALVAGQVGWACLDVFEEEPYKGPLKDLPNVIASPHVGSYALEARCAMEAAAVDNLLASLEPEGAA